MEKSFLFLYPIDEFFDEEIYYVRLPCLDERIQKEFENNLKKAKTEEEKRRLRAENVKLTNEQFKQKNASLLNQSIKERYRDNGFDIYFVLYPDTPLSPIIELDKQDTLIYTDISSLTHTTKREDGTYPYPNQDYLLNQLRPTHFLIVGGYHILDCVDKLAKRSYERGIKTLVDEDLTDLFSQRIRQAEFKTDSYPTYNPHHHMKPFEVQDFTKERKDKPWLWQYD